MPHQSSRDPQSTHVGSQARRAATLPVLGKTSTHHGSRAPAVLTPVVDDSRSSLTANAIPTHQKSIVTELPPRTQEERMAELIKDILALTPKLKGQKYPDPDIGYIFNLHKEFMLLPKNADPATMPSYQKKALAWKLFEFWKTHGQYRGVTLMEKWEAEVQRAKKLGDKETEQGFRESFDCVNFHDGMLAEIEKSQN